MGICNSVLQKLETIGTIYHIANCCPAAFLKALHPPSTAVSEAASVLNSDTMSHDTGLCRKEGALFTPNFACNRICNASSECQQSVVLEDAGVLGLNLLLSARTFVPSFQMAIIFSQFIKISYQPCLHTPLPILSLKHNSWANMKKSKKKIIIHVAF